MSDTEMTIDEEIAADWKAIQEKHAQNNPEPEPAKEELELTPSPSESSQDEKESVEPVRDAKGKFLSKQAKEPEATDPQATSTEKPTEVTPAPEPVVRDINRPPSSWKPAAKSTWDKVPPEIRAEVHRREADFLSGQSKLLPDARFGQSMRQVVEPYRLLIESEGGNPERAVSDLLRTAAVLRMGTPQQKTQAIMSVVQQYGIQMGEQPQQLEQPTQQEFRDPRVDQWLAMQQQQQQQQAQQERANLESVADRWASAVDAQGNQIRPYVDNVMDEMMALVPQIRQVNPSISNEDVLQAAYERAIRANPETWPIIEKERFEQLEAKRRTDNQQRVNLARQASSVNVPRRASIPSPAKPGSMDETIRETARALGMITN